MRAAPLVQPTLYVDDLSAEASGGEVVVARQVVKFTLSVCDAVTRHDMEVSCVKSHCMASNGRLGRMLRDGLKK